LFTHGYRNERLATLLDGHERAFRHFGGVTLSCLYDYVARHIIVILCRSRLCCRQEQGDCGCGGGRVGIGT
jgi:transposase